MAALLLAWLLGVSPAFVVAAGGTVAERLETARDHLQHGRYAEAQGDYESLLTGTIEPVDRREAAIGLSEVFAETGEWELAVSVVREALEANGDDADLWGRLAELQFATGAWAAAKQSVEAAIQRDTDALRARITLAHLHREAGESKDALEQYRWFVRYYNRVQPEDARTLRYVAAGSLEYARWKRVQSIFHFVINTLCPDALKADPQDWRTSLLSGELLLEKYNRPQAEEEFAAALAINPLAAEVHAARGRLALQEGNLDEADEHAAKSLEINPRQLSALLVRAEVELRTDDLTGAVPFIERAEAINRFDQGVLAARAAAHLLEAGLPARDRLQATLAAIPAAGQLSIRDPSKFDQLVLDLASRNPRPGRFLNDLGDFFEARRKYALAEACFTLAVEVMPELSGPHTSLGLTYMRTGRIAEAEATLDEAFKSDPFHVRVSNMRKVLGVLNGYETIRTEHFSIRVDASDAELGAYMAEYLEEVHAELAPVYGYEPPQPTQFEVYSSAKGQTAHQWFSARMTGLPWIQTIGASTGVIVALASPRATDEPYHWGRVLKHEYVHILTLQETDFNMPHWYTEALAVRTEGTLLNEQWQKLLLNRVPAGDVFTLQTVNSGFQRPEGLDDWTMAYCRCQYADFIERHWGEECCSNR
ncbi:MAG: tetratricopeptide repeat protein [Planctomycetaceae bacterium]